MGTPAIYTFKDNSRKDNKDLHLVYHSDGYPSGAADIIPDLAKVASRIWRGEAVDLEALDLPRIDQVSRRASLAQSTPPTPFRYEIDMVDGRVFAVKALRHEPIISDELEQSLEKARAALEAVEQEMRVARQVPTYVELGKGKLTAIRKLGRGCQDEE